MGDFLAPKRRDVVDRLRRRIEQYRCHHLQAGRRFDSSRLGLFEQQRQDSQHLHQRWLENKAKKAAKHSKVKDTSGTGAAASSSQTEHRNLVTQKLKRKIDSSHADNSAAAAEAFQFDDNGDQQPAANVGGSQANKSSSHTNTNVSSSTTSVGVSSAAGQEGATLPHLSVQIVQQISQSPQTIHTNVTVSSTLQTRYPGSASPSPNVNVHTSTSSQHTHSNNSGSGSHLGASNCGTNAVSKAGGSTSNPGGSGAGGGGGGGVGGAPGSETSVLTSIECKQEPLDDIHCRVSADSSAGGVPDLGIDELQDILDSIEKDGLIKELDKFNAIYDKVQRDSESNADSSIFSSLGSCSSPGLCKAAAPFTDPSQVGIQPHVSLSGGPPPALTPTMFEAAHPLGGLGATTTGLPIRPPPSLVEPTGPAAETLKQMAAQHQHQSSAATPFSSKSLEHSAFPDPYDACGFGRRNGYPAAYQNQTFSPVGATTGGAGYAGYGQSSGYESPTPMTQYTGGKRDLNPLAYGGTKPLTHYPTEHGGPGNHGGQPATPSSLQQLQNQVASHFSPMHITQTQHVQLSQGTSRFQLSQTQQVQMAAAAQQQQQQQQQQGGPTTLSLSQQQSFSMGPHMQRGQGPAGQSQPPAGMGMAPSHDVQFLQDKMRREQQQYLNRPPPEYKMHPGVRPPGPAYPGSGGGGGSGGSSTPLQTMQNMVNQTPPYASVKGEVSAPGGVMTQLSAVQSLATSGSSGGSQHMAQGSQNMAVAYHQQQQRPPSYSPHANVTTPNGVNSTTNVANNVTNAAGSNNGSSHLPTSTAAVSQVTSGYTSALLRNQRPPNVNVGPEGLNISQPRTHPGHPGHMAHSHPHSHMHAESWPRVLQDHSVQSHVQTHAGAVNRGGGAAGTLGTSPVATVGGNNLLSAAYGARPGSAGSVAGSVTGSVAGIANAGPMVGAPGNHAMIGGVGVGGTQVMMQQSVQMSQRGVPMRPGSGVAMGHPSQQAMPPHSGGYGMLGPASLQGQGGATHAQQYGAGSPQDDFLPFFDSAQPSGYDPYDPMAHGSSSSDFNLFDEILSGGK